MRFLVEVILVLALLAGNTFSVSEQEPAPEAAVPAFSQTAEESEAAKTEKEIDLSYVNYDPTLFYSMTEELSELGAGEDEAAVTELYDKLYDELLYIDALDVIAYFNYSADVTDEYWSEEQLAMDELWAECADALSVSCAAVLSGPCAEAFAEHIGEDNALELTGYEALSEEELSLDRREGELVQEYYEVMDSAEADAVYEYEGKTWTMEDIRGFSGDALAARDYDAYLEVYDGLQKWINDSVGDIFTELLSVRTRIAELSGYDSYADYAYECVYARDYTTEDAQKFCDQVKPLAREYSKQLYYDDRWYEYEDVQPVMDEEELIEVLGRYAPVIDSVVYDGWKELTENGLYDLNTGENAMSGAYTAGIAKWETGFIYAALSGDCYDFSALTHEFGHFIDTCVNPIPNLLTSEGCYDLFEIHSNGLEMLYTTFYDDIYTKKADSASFIEVGNQMESLISGCIMDEFQRRVYAEPDMTLEEINAVYTAVLSEYGQNFSGTTDYGWVNVSHNFENPLYYISYAASALPALEIWSMAQTDRQAAADMWLAVLNAGAYDAGYLQVLSDCGFSLFTEDGTVEAVCRPVVAYMEGLSR